MDADVHGPMDGFYFFRTNEVEIVINWWLNNEY